jgi:3-phenylpropionate/cinnamic acid dioxygenase small subunit
VTPVAALTDRFAIVDLLHRYATGLDTRDWDKLASVFTHDGVADYGALGGVNEGPAAIVKLCSGALEGLDASQHIISNEVIEVDGDRARARCYFKAQHVFRGAEGGDNFLVGGTYEDEIVRTAEGWRIERRTLTATWTDGNPVVFEAAAARLAAKSAH